mgnify:CR=1 FL=1
MPPVHRDRLRYSILAGSTILQNGYFVSLIRPGIYQGVLKGCPTPSLNCYSCPFAYFSCPLGLLQHWMVIRSFPFYILGFFAVIGSIAGRIQCGWLCPFGLLQELLYKIKSVKIKLPRGFLYLKYPILILTLGFSFYAFEPFFCQFICPQGTLQAGIPHVLLFREYRSLAGILYYWKLFLLLLFLSLSIFIKRPFCRAVCPLGLIYGILNRISLVKYRVDMNLCVKCNLCQDVCPMDIRIYEDPQSAECIRCDRCRKVCPRGAIKREVG